MFPRWDRDQFRPPTLADVRAEKEGDERMKQRWRERERERAIRDRFDVKRLGKVLPEFIDDGFINREGANNIRSASLASAS